MSAIFRDGGVYDEVFVMEVVARIAVAEGLSVKRRSARAYDGFDTEIAMIHYPAPPIPKAIIDEMEALVSSGMPQQEVIHQMRAAGLNIVECMKLTSLFNRVDGNEAKRIVHFTRWQLKPRSRMGGKRWKKALRCGVLLSGGCIG